MKKFKFLTVAVLAIMSVFGLTSCDKEDNPTTPNKIDHY